MKFASGISLLCGLGCIMLGPAAWAEPLTAGGATGDSTFAAPPVSDSMLEDARGGFDLGNGLVTSFGISRAVYVNGNLVVSTRVNIPDLSHISSEQANALAAALGTVSVIHNGAGNSVDPGAFDHATGALVIQNTLDNQQIQALTTLTASVRDLGQFNGINLGNSLQSALINSRGQ